MDYDEIYDKKINELLTSIVETSIEHKNIYNAFDDEGKEIILQKINAYDSDFTTVFKKVQYDIDHKHAKDKGEDEEDYVNFKHLGTNFNPYNGTTYPIKSNASLRVLICGSKSGYNKALFEYFRKNAPNIISLGYSLNGNEIENIVETFHPHIVFVTVTLFDEKNCTAIKGIVETFPTIKVVSILGSDAMQAQVERAGACQIFSRYDPFTMLLEFAYNTDYENINFVIPDAQYDINAVETVSIKQQIKHRFKPHFPQLTNLKSLFRKHFI